MDTLENFIPNMTFPLPPHYEFHKSPTSTATAPYSASIPPNQKGRPAFIVHDPSLPHRMLESLRAYLRTAQRRDASPSPALVHSISILERTIMHHPLDSESSSTRLFDRGWDPIGCAVEEVDANSTQPVPTIQTTLFSQRPDVIYCPYAGAEPQLHIEFKSWTAFSHHAESIVQLGRNRAVLELNRMETGHRSIVFKVHQSQSSILCQIFITNFII
jgi:hypothetical protein